MDEVTTPPEAANSADSREEPKEKSRARQLAARIWGHRKRVFHFLRHNVYWFVVGIALLTYFAPKYWPENKPDPVKVDYSVIQTMIANRDVKSVTIYDLQHKIQVVPANGGRPHEATFVAESGDELQEKLDNAKIDYKVEGDGRGFLSRNFGSVLAFIFPFIFILLLLLLLKTAPKLMAREVTGDMDFKTERPKERFKHVKGADEAIEEVELIVHSLSDPEGHAELQLPRGIIFEGPTGTGKTMLAKAVAGEAGVPFYRLAGAAMTSMFVGATTQRIQTFFANVKKDLPTTDSPAVVFIDEIDGIATERGGKQASDKDRNSALTQLLHEIGEMHDKYPNVVIIGATNRFDELDNALKRAGRLGTHITMPNPDLLARLDILRENAGKLKLEGVELETIAELTAGLSGASVAAVPPAAAKVARKRGGKGTPANRHDFERAAMETVMGMLRTKRFVSAENQRIAAAHESGHSVLAYASPHHQLLITTTYPIKESGGSTWFAAGDRMVHTADSILWDVAVSMGGRAGEVIDQRRPSTGCGHDVQQATRLVLAVICAGGVYDDFITEVDVRNWQDHPLAGKISEKVQEVLAEGMKLAQETLLKHAAYRSAIQEELLDKRILHSDELAALALAHRAEGTDPTT